MAFRPRLLAFLFAVALLFSALPHAQARDIVKLTDSNFDELVTKDSRWVVDFYADWCGVCRRLEGEFYQLSHQIDEISPAVNLGKVNVDENPSLTLRFFITRLPSVYFIHDGAIRTWNTTLQHEEIFTALNEEKWKDMEIWSGVFSPNGIFGSMFGFIGFLQATIQKIVPGNISPMIVVLVISGITGLVVYRIYKNEPATPAAATKPTKPSSPSGSAPSSPKAPGRRRTKKID
ncbi:thioredoxin-like protein [Basidiobolus meristosporus CBS 931.73]|uniref:Thioredoxin-like protein n=1 Tax=Basidiobolus meristosporus CBS 931.73 TaxID=1314790 RepID=A0A1Y1YK82_9FUNG|nr:thioredoxin-like protein [Basidiobolus meristosporus CBS 931.73]|eukprot:ORX98004.1 thioredoxin-like protein [Basidiobolus meristosporus CBS 931.73]